MMLEVPLDCLKVLQGVRLGDATGGEGGNVHGVLADVLPPDIDDGAE